MSEKTFPPTLGAEQMAARQGWSIATLARRARAGLVPTGIKVGGARRWLLSAVEQWEAAGRPPVAELHQEVGHAK